MLPNPLHPAIVHFPIVLMFLLPISAAGALWAIRRGARHTRAWAIPVAVAAALTLSSWAAVETGEQQEDRVEKVVADSVVEQHAESAEAFLAFTAATLVLMAAGLMRNRAGSAIRVTATVAALGLIVAGARVGHSGGELVYTHGAAAAFATSGSAAGGNAMRAPSRKENDER